MYIFAFPPPATRGIFRFFFLHIFLYFFSKNDYIYINLFFSHRLFSDFCPSSPPPFVFFISRSRAAEKKSSLCRRREKGRDGESNGDRLFRGGSDPPVYIFRRYFLDFCGLSPGISNNQFCAADDKKKYPFTARRAHTYVVRSDCVKGRERRNKLWRECVFMGISFIHFFFFFLVAAVIVEKIRITPAGELSITIYFYFLTYYDTPGLGEGV